MTPRNLWPTPSWRLQMCWRQIDIEPSATTKMFQTWLQYYTNQIRQYNYRSCQNHWTNAEGKPEGRQPIAFFYCRQVHFFVVITLCALGNAIWSKVRLVKSGKMDRKPWVKFDVCHSTLTKYKDRCLGDVKHNKEWLREMLLVIHG